MRNLPRAALLTDAATGIDDDEADPERGQPLASAKPVVVALAKAAAARAKAR